MRYENKPIGTIAYLGGLPALTEEFVWSWTQMVQYNSQYLCDAGEYVHYDRSKVSYHSFARNSLSSAIQGEWLLMLDTDHQFEPDLAVRMVHKMKKFNIDILTAFYQYKLPPHLPVLYYWNNDKNCYEVLTKWVGDPEIFEVGSAGGGCLLVKKKVYDRIRAELKEGPFDIIPPYSEDHSFFCRCRKLGIKAWCAPKIEHHHLTMRAIKPEDMDLDSVSSIERPSVEGFGMVR